MSDQVSEALREQVRSRYAEAARAVLEPGTGQASADCFGGPLYGEGETDGLPAEMFRAEYLDGLAAAGFADASVTFTAEAAPGMHSTIVRAVKPAAG